MSLSVIRVDIAMFHLSSAINNTGHYHSTETRLLVAFLRPICKDSTAAPTRFELVTSAFGGRPLFPRARWIGHVMKSG